MLDRSAVGQLSSLSSRTKWQRLPAGDTIHSVAIAVIACGRRPSLQLVAGFRPTTDIALSGRFTRLCPACEEPATTANFVAESSQVAMHSGKLN